MIKNLSTHQKTLALLLTLYFAQGLPAGFITQALPAILRQYQVSLVHIGWSGLILTPWAIKFLWATWVDSHYSEKMGRSRGWILPLQLLSASILLYLAFFDPSTLNTSSSLILLYALLFCLSLIGATHDIATDGLATRLLKPFTDNQNSLSNDNVTKHQHQQSQGNAIQVIGYRLGLIIGGGGLMIFLDKIGWKNSFLLMALLVFLNTLPILCYTEPKFLDKKTNIPRQKFHLKRYIAENYAYFWQNKEMLAWLGVLLTFKLTDGISSGMVKPMMIDLGVTLESMGIWVTILGSGASLTGAWVATFFLKKIPIIWALLIFNALQALTTGLYGAVAYGFGMQFLQNFAWIYAVNALEHFCSALALIAMLTTIMNYARHDKAGSDYTFQMCLLTLVSGFSHFISGYMVHFLGYSQHFFVSMLLGGISLMMIVIWSKRKLIS